MFVVTVTFSIEEKSLTDFLEKMKEQADNSLTREPDCLQFDICSDPENEHIVFLYEVYTDKEAFGDHLNSDHFKKFDSTVRDWVVSKEVQIWTRL